jgi:hypothetical protein
MKTLKIFAVLCLFVVLPTTKAISQVTRESFPLEVTINKNECLDEDVSGTITVQRLSAINSGLERGRGILIGSESGDEYSLSYEIIGSGHFGLKNIATGGFTYPMLLFHEGKLIEIIHESYRSVILVENYWTGPFIVDRYVSSIECK